ncbi:MAG: divergent polysaccharide deacetylase family protein [Spirochaetia bacterium]|nr:divergent polysaccharide deacetylase family protein [Spirochaetia bacterium]
MKKYKVKILAVLIVFIQLGHLAAEEKSQKIHPQHIDFNTLALNINELWAAKDCGYHISNDSGYMMVSFACEEGYNAFDRKNFLDILFSNGFILKKETYQIEKRQGIYLYKMEFPAYSGQFIYFKIFFRDASYLWPKTPIERKLIAIYAHDLYRHDDLIRWQTLGIPISYGVLADKPETSLICEKIREYEQELWLALPLEPLVISPDKGEFISVEEAHDKEKLKSYLDESLKQTGKVLGFSNKMGSKFMSEIYVVRQLLTLMKELDIHYFLDTWTTKDSRGHESAAIMGMNSYKRDIILDHRLSDENLQKHWQWFEKAIGQNETGIIVVHAGHLRAFEFLKEKIESLKDKVDFVWISKLPRLEK